ncbi:uncharacterized protein H6S33_004938 [Morchella sextelata]|uniref:uncharacterized protein n=1 Tax=Morchella sextelata TaxID=1174677 RepID=UPI001D049E1E|nr:uncharacterized protein H6S33_004938 [Morchella sextelata]KAH0604956.1 hypothetical protein H6S33_004938 [Morchella sextelata]
MAGVRCGSATRFQPKVVNSTSSTRGCTKFCKVKIIKYSSRGVLRTHQRQDGDLYFIIDLLFSTLSTITIQPLMQVYEIRAPTPRIENVIPSLNGKLG